MKSDSQPSLTAGAIRAYLQDRLGSDLEITEIRPLGQKEGDVKGFGYGRPLLLRVRQADQDRRLVLHTLRRNPFDHQYMADRAGDLVLAFHAFNELPRHVGAVDLGTVDANGTLRSTAQPEEFFLLTEYACGQAYAEDLSRIAQTDRLQEKDNRRVTGLAEYLARIHGVKSQAPDLYQRRVRETVGHGEGILGMLDTFPANVPEADLEVLEAIERRCVAWRWKIKSRTHRLSQVHGDFHPWNVLFDHRGEMTLLDRSRGPWGEPADDVSAMDINYLFFSLRAHGRLAGPFHELHHRFWDVYLSNTADTEILEVAPLFYVWRALVLAHPWWYPDLSTQTRISLLHFVDAMLDCDRFDPEAVNTYLR